MDLSRDLTLAATPVTRLMSAGDFWIPQRGIFMIGSSVFEPFDPATHLAPGH
ncbi:hypothetical protein [Arthrobacter sp. UYCu712]|uniref:hypothetical protein n=1 Tax=Arthrobacter sp. UYCu712 TaxID=3156340 RepID=UPI00339498C5